MNELQPEDIEWRFIRSMNGHVHHSICRDERYKIQFESISTTKPSGEPGKPKHYFYIDNHSAEFHSEEELCDAWNKIYDFDKDNPEFKLVYLTKQIPKTKDNGR